MVGRITFSSKEMMVVQLKKPLVKIMEEIVMHYEFLL
jgi:hypothetical protein